MNKIATKSVRLHLEEGRAKTGAKAAEESWVAYITKTELESILGEGTVVDQDEEF